MPTNLTHANIINILGIESLPLDERKEIVESALELIETRILVRVVNSVKPGKKGDILRALESQDEEMLKKATDDSSIDILNIIEEEIEKLKKEFVEIVNEK